VGVGLEASGASGRGWPGRVARQRAVAARGIRAMMEVASGDA
jgi:hypothetical protein